MKQLDGFFRLSQRGTTLGREIRGGCTTFCSMVYLILVIPGLLSGAGMDFEKVMTATCLIAAAGSIVSGLVSNLPFALAPGLGFTTLFTHTLCQKYGCTWQQALALVLVSGVLFLALTFSPLRERLNDALPMPFKFALSAGVGLFLTLSGLINAGLITADDNLVDMGTLAAPEPLLALLGIFVTAVLVMKKVPGALMLGMALTVALGIPLGVTALPQTLTAAPELSLAALKPDFTGLLALGPIPLVSALLSLLVSQYFDALGTLLAVAGDAKLTDTTGDLDGQREAMLCCGAVTCAGALLGVSNVTAMAESATGIREGTRTGLSAVITGLLFLCMLPFTPLAGVVTGAALAAPLVMVGMSMMSGITQITWKHVEISLPSFLMIVGMPFTFSITTGVMLGVVSYVVVMLCRKRAHLIDPVLYLLAAVFVLNAVLGTLQ
mgnify:FL=1